MREEIVKNYTPDYTNHQVMISVITNLQSVRNAGKRNNGHGRVKIYSHQIRMIIIIFISSLKHNCEAFELSSEIITI